MNSHILTVGLEIHAELRTRTKMFCNSKNDPDETRPNVNICPVCMGHPGTLPVINKEAVKHVLRVGLALGGRLADFTEFDRKNYFYPDIPKGYQISQYKYPLVSGGILNGVSITRIHLEEDTATSLHENEKDSLVDFNRAGVPLMELVTEPVIHSSKEAGDFARELQLLLRYLKVSAANMEKGEMRVEANISLRIKGSASPRGGEAEPLGTKVEIKNLNSFKSVEAAINYEVARQSELLERGEKVIQETRGWDEIKQKTILQRRKEESHDYRYFPDPDLPKLRLSEVPEFASGALGKDLPELPSERRKRYRTKFKITKEAGETLVANRSLSQLFDYLAEGLEEGDMQSLAINYITSDLLGLLKKAKMDSDEVQLKFSADSFLELIHMIQEKKISSRGAKDILAILFSEGGSPSLIAEAQGFLQRSDESELQGVVEKIISSNPKVVADWKNGKVGAIQFLVGQGMRETRGAGNPEILRRLIEKLLS